MKTSLTRIPSVTDQIPRRAPAAAMRIKNLRLMKTKLTILKSLFILGSAFATTAVFGQAPLTYVWTNQSPGQLQGVGDLNVTTNWNPNGAPTPMTQPRMSMAVMAT